MTYISPVAFLQQVHAQPSPQQLPGDVTILLNDGAGQNVRSKLKNLMSKTGTFSAQSCSGIKWLM